MLVKGGGSGHSEMMLEPKFDEENRRLVILECGGRSAS